MENKHTPVEFLIENLKNVLTKSQFNDVVIQDIFEQAKTMDNEPKMVEDDVEKLAEEEYSIFDGDLLGIANNQKHSRIDFIKGYNKAKETFYTEEQVRKAIDMARTLIDSKCEFDVESILGSSDGTYGIKEKYTEDKIIQLLKQPKNDK
jgi:hypothetical protein